MSRRFFILVAAALIMGACDILDDDLSVCGVDCRIEYQMRLQTKMRTKVDDVLRAEDERPLADTLAKWLTPVFSNHAHDIDLTFYSTDGTDEQRHYSTESVNGQTASFTFYLPRENYNHLALVNNNMSDGLYLIGADHSVTYTIRQGSQDTLPSLTAPVYTARALIDAADQEENHTFMVDLYMTTCAVALVLDTTARKMPHITACLLGTASAFSVSDSTFHYENSRPVRCEQVNPQCFAVVSLPSRDNAQQTPTRQQQPPKKYTASASTSLWQMAVYVTIPDGSVTQTVLDIDYPLQADALEIIKCTVQDDGSLVPAETTHIGATVQLDWNKGSDHNLDI